MESITLKNTEGHSVTYTPDDILWFFEETTPGLVRIVDTKRQLETFPMTARQAEQIRRTLKASHSPIWFGAFQGERLPLRNLPNTRGLGGLPAQTGSVIGYHRLIRSGALHGATSGDIRYLTQEMGLKTVVDLRTELEIAAKPDPDIPGVQWIHVPFLNTLEYEEIGLRTLTESGLEEMKQRGPDMMKALYRKIVAAPEGIRGLRKFFSILLEQPEGAVLWHCTQGKDRTGVAAAVLERILGCSQETVEQDYLQTNPCLKPEMEDTESWLEKTLHLQPAAAGEFSFLFEARPAFLQAAWDAIEEEFGGFDAWLQNELGLSEEKREKLRKLYTC